jgi:glucose/arabinose dehydrogenase
MKRHTLLACAAALVAAGAGCSFGSTPQAKPGEVYELHGERFSVQAVAENLVVPWALAWLPDGRLLATERPGRLQAIDPATGRTTLVAELDEVDRGGEHGLMGLAPAPDFTESRHVFMSYTGRGADGRPENVIARWRLEGGGLSAKALLVRGLPAADYHDGLPLAFGPDGCLYASTGDATQGELAQRMDSLAGKFLRMRADGSRPADNPFNGSLIWTVGHRNCQGFDWHPTGGALLATEHGPSFPLDGVGGKDEVNRIVRGANYGWPTYRGETNGPGCTVPLVQSGSDTWAPAGAAFYTGTEFPAWRGVFFFAGLRGQGLYALRLSDDGQQVKDLTRVLHGAFGRLRAVAMGPDGRLYVTTSNRDGRGDPAANDDRVLRLVPSE